MRIPAVLLTTAALLLPCIPAGGQGAEVRSEVVALRDSMRGKAAEDLRQILRSLESRNRMVADDPAAAILTGTAALSLASVTGQRGDFGVAIDRFQRVVDLRPDWSLGWSSLGWAELGELESGGIDLTFRRLFGAVPENAIAQRFVSGWKADSTDVAEIVAMAEAGLADAGGSREKVALRMMRLLDREAVLDSPRLGVLLARLEYAAGDRDSALSVIERTVARSPRDAAAGRLLGIYSFLHGTRNGVAPWYRALELADERELAAFARDLVPVIPDSVMAKLAAMDGPRRVEAVRKTWADHDPDGLPTADERLREHYRRLMFARRHYLDEATRTSGVPYQSDTLPLTALDDRGRIMMRHGTPLQRSSLGPSGGPEVEQSLRVVGMPPNETWLYRSPDGEERLYHFLADHKGGTFRSVESIFDIIAASGQFRRFRSGQEPLDADSNRVTVKTYGAELVSMVAQQVLLSRASTSDLYVRMLNEGKGGADSLQQRERETGRASLALLGSYELAYELDLAAATQLSVLGSDERGGVIQLAFAVPSEELISERLARGFAHRLRFRISVLDRDGRPVTTVDTVRTFVTAERIPRGRHLLGQIPVRVGPGSYRVRAAIETPGRGALTDRVDLVVPDVGSGRLSITDVALGSRSVPIAWRAPGADTAWVNPLGRYDIREPMQLYFEVGGLGEGTPYRVNLAIDRYSGRRRGCGGGGRQLSINFDQRHGGGVDRVQREVSLDRMEPGRYGMVVEVMSGDQRVTSCREFEIVR